MSSVRQEKVSRLMQKELSTIFQKHRSFSGGAFVTVTMVRVSPDLSLAKAYLSVLGKGEKDRLLKLVNSQTKSIRRELGLLVRNQLRHVPELVFYVDDSLDYAEKIDRLLKNGRG